MPKQPPKPRACRLYGTKTVAYVARDGTWIEDEALAYPGDTFTRRAYVKCPDGKLRVVKCKVADTYFSVPARLKMGGKTVKGVVSSDDSGSLKFTPYDDQSAKEG